MLDGFGLSAITVGPEWIALIGVAAFAGGFIRGFVGFGGAVLLILAVSAVIGPREAVAIAALSGLPPMLQLLPAAVREADRSFAVPYGLAAFIGAPLGTWMLVSIDPDAMKIAIALFVLTMVLVLYRSNGIRIGTNRLAFAGTGMIAGWIQGIAGVAGPPTVAIALARGGTVQQQRANVIGAITPLNFCALPALWWYGLFTREVVLLALLLIPLYSFGTWLGQRHFSEQGQHYYRKAALAALSAIGLLTLAVGVRDYLVG